MKQIIALFEAIHKSPNIHKMTFVDTPTNIIRITRRRTSRKGGNSEYVLTIGRPNANEKILISKLKKSHHNFELGFIKIVIYKK